MVIRGLKARIGAPAVAVALAGTALIAGLGGAAGAAPASATPGSPGAPEAPTVLFTENFEHYSSGGVAQTAAPLGSYTSAAGHSYGADSYWLDLDSRCNGAISWAGIITSGARCTGFAVVPRINSQKAAMVLADSLSSVNGKPGNKALTEMSAGVAPVGQAMFRTLTPEPLQAGGRFLVFSLSAAATTCGATHPLITASATGAGGPEVTLASAPLDPCADAGSAQLAATTPLNTGAVRGGAFALDGSVLVEGDSFTFAVKNMAAAPNGNGNDLAFDDLKVIDATPKLDKSFAPVGAIGRGATLIFTVTNTSDLHEKAGWSFTDALPQGVEIASPAAASTDCPATTITADEGSGSVSATGTIGAGAVSCTVSVDVTSDAVGDYTNGPDNVTVRGLEKPGATTIRFTDPKVFVEAHAGTPVDVNGDGLTDAGDTIAYRYTVTNTGDVPLTGISVSDPKVGAITCPAVTLAPSDSVECAADAVYTITAQDVTDGSVATSAVAMGQTAATGPVSSPPATTSTPTVAPRPALVLVKSVNPAGPAALEAGDSVTFSFLVTNTGNVPLAPVSITEGAFTGTGTLSTVTCGSGAHRLAIDGVLRCEADYVVTQADIEAGGVSNTATASGTGVGGGATVSSEPSTAAVALSSDPALSVRVTASPDRATQAGQKIVYSVKVTNTGNRVVDAPVARAVDFSGAGELGPVDCPTEPAALAPGEHIVCTAEYIVDARDLTGRPIRLSAVASGTVGAAAVESPEAAGSLETASAGNGGSGNGKGSGGSGAASGKGGLAATGAEPASITVPAAAVLLALGGLALVTRRRATR